MKSTNFDETMRIFESAHEVPLLPDVYLAVRLDGQSFTSLTHRLEFEKPFSIIFHQFMLDTLSFLMQRSGFKFLYGYTQSDEISLLFDPMDKTFAHRPSKITSILAGKASAYITHRINEPTFYPTFDCRIIQLPSMDHVTQYFRWRQEDASRNALNGWCHYTLIEKENLSATVAAKRLNGVKAAEKHELLFQHGINYDKLPSWQRRGSGCFWTTYFKEGLNRKTQEIIPNVKRRKVDFDFDLPMKDLYESYIRKICLLSGKSDSASEEPK